MAHKINLRSVSDINIHRCRALRAIFKFSAGPRVWPMGCNFAWCWCMWLWVLNFAFEYVNEHWWAYNWFHMAFRHGPTLKFVFFQAILSMAGGDLHQLLPATLFTFCLVFCLCSNVCRQFWISFCPAGAVMMWIQILQGIIPRTFLVQSYGVLKLWSMVIQFEIFLKNEIYEIEKSMNFGQQNKFAQRFRYEVSSGFCAARNIKVFRMMLVHGVLGDEVSFWIR